MGCDLLQCEVWWFGAKVTVILKLNRLRVRVRGTDLPKDAANLHWAINSRTDAEMKDARARRGDPAAGCEW